MKFWNKRRGRDQWIQVNLNLDRIGVDRVTLKNWCKQYASPYRFYNYSYDQNIWLFEHEPDAVMFVLTWSK